MVRCLGGKAGWRRRNFRLIDADTQKSLHRLRGRNQSLPISCVQRTCCRGVSGLPPLMLLLEACCKGASSTLGCARQQGAGGLACCPAAAGARAPSRAPFAPAAAPACSRPRPRRRSRPCFHRGCETRTRPSPNTTGSVAKKQGDFRCSLHNLDLGAAARLWGSVARFRYTETRRICLYA